MEAVNANFKNIDVQNKNNKEPEKGEEDFSKILEIISDGNLTEEDKELILDSDIACALDPITLNLIRAENIVNIKSYIKQNLSIENLNLEENKIDSINLGGQQSSNVSLEESRVDNSGLINRSITETDQMDISDSLLDKKQAKTNQPIIPKDLEDLNLKNLVESENINTPVGKENEGSIGKVLGGKFENAFIEENIKSEESKKTYSKKKQAKENVTSNLKKDNLNVNSLVDKGKSELNIGRNLNDEEQETLDLNLKNFSKNLSKKDISPEKMQGKPFNIEGMGNSFRKIELKDINSKDIGLSKISKENIEILKDSMVKLIETGGTDGTKSMNVKLVPKNLGSIDISLNMEEGKLVAKLMFENEQARHLFSNNIKQLNQSLQKQNISIEEIQIDLNLNSQGGHGNSNGDGRNPKTPFRGKGINFEEINLEEEKIIRGRRIDNGGVSILV